MASSVYETKAQSRGGQPQCADERSSTRLSRCVIKFELVYQPIIETRQWRIKRLRLCALATPTKGIVSPADFNPSGQETG